MNHPLIELILTYVQEYEEKRVAHSDLSNLDFHKNYGLYINAPVDWPNKEALHKVLTHLLEHKKSAVVIYGNTEEYKIASKLLPDDGMLNFISWHEIYFAINTVQADMRPVKHVKDMLSHADVVIFFGANRTTSDVIDHIRTYCDNCLLLMG